MSLKIPTEEEHESFRAALNVWRPVVITGQAFVSAIKIKQPLHSHYKKSVSPRYDQLNSYFMFPGFEIPILRKLSLAF